MSEILAILLPVFVMMILGAVIRRMGIMPPEQEQGIKNLTFNVLMPVLIFNSLFTTELSPSVLLVILFVFCLHNVGLCFGFLTGRFTTGRFAHVSPFMLCTMEGGNIGIPLYLTLAGSARSGNIIMLDIAGLFIIFLVAPILVAVKSAQTADTKQLVKNICTNSVVIAMVLGLILNLAGVQGLLQNAGLYNIYEQTESMITGPIVALILFTIGYDFQIEKNSLPPLLKLAASRVLVMGLGILVFMKLFSGLVQDPYMMAALLLYFMCPPAFIMPSQVNALVKSEEEAGFLSAFVSLYMVITLIAYICCVVFILR